MPIVKPSDQDREFMKQAYVEAKAGYDEGGLPICAVMVEAGRVDRKSTRLNSSHSQQSRMPSSA